MHDHRIYWQLVCLYLFCSFQAGCMSLDQFLFNPDPVSKNTDLLGLLEGVPSTLREELPLLATADGGQIQTWLLRHEATDGTNQANHATFVLYCHGNARHLGYYAPRMAHLWRLGYSVFALDYRGFGKSPGKPSEANLYQDGTAAWHYLQNYLATTNPASKVLIYGFSLGGVVATYLATTYQSPYLALEATFSNVSQLIDDSATFDLADSWFVESHMDNLSRIATYQGRLLLLHGQEDTFVRSEHSKRLHQAALMAQSNQLQLVAKARHDTVPCSNPTSRAKNAGDCPEGLASYYPAQLAELMQ